MWSKVGDGIRVYHDWLFWAVVNVIVYSRVSSGTSEAARVPMMRVYLDSLLDIHLWHKLCVFPAFCFLYFSIWTFAPMMRLPTGHSWVCISCFLFLYFIFLFSVFQYFVFLRQCWECILTPYWTSIRVYFPFSFFCISVFVLLRQWWECILTAHWTLRLYLPINFWWAYLSSGNLFWWVVHVPK